MGAIQSSFSNTKVARQIKQALGDEALYAFPDEPFYAWDHVKCYNLDLITTPYCVTYPKTSAQVAALVKIAADAGLKVQAKSGGHSYCNFSSPDGGVVIDLKHFQAFKMDPKTFVCDVGAGTLLGDLDERLHKQGKRAIAHGVCPQVGIGGHATIGGLGPSSRKFGAALDHIEAGWFLGSGIAEVSADPVTVKMVTADGYEAIASEDDNADLFWAIRGAGASFGVITEFRMRTEPSPESTVEYSYSFTSGSWADMAKVFKSWQKFIADQNLTDNFASQATINPLGLVISGTFFGTQAEFDDLSLKPEFPLKVKETGKRTVVLDDWLGSLTHWAEEVALLLGGGIPAHAYTKTLTFSAGDKDSIPDDVVDKMFQYIEQADKGTYIWFIIFDLAGGKVNKVGPHDTAFAHRDALFYLQAYAINHRAETVNPVTKAFLKGLIDLIVQDVTAGHGHFEDHGAYPGYVDLEIKNPQKAYWRDNLSRLEKIKLKYDPKDVFHNPQSVRPDGKEVPYTLPEFAKTSNLPWWTRLFK